MSNPRKGKNKRPLATEIRHRINAGKVAILNQVSFFENNLGNVSSEWKEDNTRVTFADFAISEKLFHELRESFPEDNFCSEESSPQDEVLQLNAEFTWILDPIDGTNNYYLGLPLCAISLALLRNGEPIYGFIYDLSRKTLIQGGPRHGLTDGSRRVQSSEAPLGSQSIIALHFPFKEGPLSKLTPLLKQHRIRSLGSGALNLCYTAIGKMDGCLDYKVKIWDIAAGYALIQAIGGEFHFISEPVFPLKTFHVNAEYIQYFAGTPDYCRYMSDLLKS